MPCKLRNKPITRKDIKKKEARRLLANVYCAAVARWKERLRQTQAFANRALISTRRIPLLHGTDPYQNCSFDPNAMHVVLHNELNGDAVAYQFPPSASTAEVYAAARNFLKLPNSISLRLWVDLPWIARAHENTLAATGNKCIVGYLRNTTIAVQAINHEITRDHPGEP